ncbi:hypothetical protein J6590_065732 [Homalodisca vitripennis]|nr:hypothetical protein J6590_065732 [Homalodisca vitripennis]
MWHRRGQESWRENNIKNQEQQGRGKKSRTGFEKQGILYENALKKAFESRRLGLLKLLTAMPISHAEPAALRV